MPYEELSKRLAGEYPYRVLAVDDDPIQRLVLADSLEAPKYRVTVVESAAQGLRALQADEFDVVVTDRSMPGMDGDTFCRQIRQVLGLPMLPILMVTGQASASDLNDGLASGADDFLRKPYHPVELMARVDSAVQRKRYTDQLDSTESTLFALARMVEAKDENTGDHCTRLAHNAVRLGQALGLPAADLMALRRGGVLHDIGKLGIPDTILLKPARLDAEEWRVMRQHTTIGHQLVSQLRSMRLTAPIIRHHHERWDGSGYPDALVGEEIPLLARVFQVVDIFDALRFERPYKPAMSSDQACALLQEEVEQGWRDPHICAAFFELLRIEPGAMDGTDPASADLGRTLYSSLALEQHP